jgi:excinuclease ABC subunit B
MRQFEVVSPYKPEGDQPQAIDKLVAGVLDGRKFQTLMGVTGSGKTFTMAHTIARLNRPTLVISHNKTLAAQLYEEFKELFPNNAVGYFVSYYDYYQPEAYIPQRDIYIEKDASRNDDLDRLRLSATSNLVSRNDVLLVASVSCIFGLGSPVDYKASVLPLRRGETVDRDEMLRKLIDLQYSRNDVDFRRATFRVRGDVVELHPSYEEFAYRIEFFGDELTAIDAINPLTGEVLSSEQQVFIYPAVHYVIPEDRVQEAVRSIRKELEEQVMHLRGQGKLLEAQRLLARTKYDLEMILEVGYCSGIENYSRHLDGRKPGEKPYTLIDYFPKDFLLIIDESHVTLPQIRAMYNGDQQRKTVLVDHGFRLPSALDNRPLKFEEFQEMWKQVVFVSATPGKFELEKTGGEVVEQVIRPTGLVDPVIEVHPAQGQVPHLLEQIKPARRRRRARPGDDI